MNPEQLSKWAAEFRLEAVRILSSVESSKTRRVTLDSSYAQLNKLSLKQDELFRQALRCVEHELYRAAHVMAWSALMDFLHELIVKHYLNELDSSRPKWKVRKSEDLRGWSDYQVIDAAQTSGIFSKSVCKGLHGLLNKRNECAHPEDYYPGLNDTLGYIDEIFKRIRHIGKCL